METAVLQSNWENDEHQRYFWNVIVLQEKGQSGMRKLNRMEERSLVWGFCGWFTCPDLCCD